MECFFKLLPRERIDLANGRLRVLNRFEQILSLRFKECMPLGSFLVFLQSHHVDRTHAIEPGAHFAINLILDSQLLAFSNRNRRIGHQFRPLHAQLV